MRGKDVTSATIVAILITFALAPLSPAQEMPNDCTDGHIEGSSDERNGSFKLSANCEVAGRPDARGDRASASSTLSTSGQGENPIEVKYVSGCYPDQLQNPDFQDCEYQRVQFCGDDGSWLQRQETDARREEEADQAVSYGPRFCAQSGSGSPADANSESFSISDVAALITVAPRIHADNGGRGIRHAHTNFYSDADVIVENTTLNGRKAMLRATPIEYRWDYGDGTQRTTAVAGSSQSEFNVQTPTSHIYEDTGAYDVRLATVFIGEYSLDGGQTWVLLEGTITRDSDPAQADIFRSVTRNVAEDCVSNPSGWGCGVPGSEPAD